MKKSVFRRLVGSAIAGAAATVMVICSSTPASAYVTDNLEFFFDFTTLTSVSNGTVVSDLSPNGRDATVQGSLTVNSTTHALEFPGGVNSTAYLALAGDFSDFSSGLTIEFEGEFGSTRADWERIFDFGIPGGEANDIWLGQYYGSNELGLEIWHSGVSVGYCVSDTGGTGLGAYGSRDMAKYLVTVGGGYCHMYKDGVEIPTVVYTNGTPSASSPNGSAYLSPTIGTRTNNYVGRSNWLADNDLEGSIRYVRVYGSVLTPTQVLENATNSSTPESSGSGGSSDSQLPTTGTDATRAALMAAGAGALVLTGVALVIIRRRNA